MRQRESQLRAPNLAKGCIEVVGTLMIWGLVILGIGAAIYSCGYVASAGISAGAR